MYHQDSFGRNQRLEACNLLVGKAKTLFWLRKAKTESTEEWNLQFQARPNAQCRIPPTDTATPVGGGVVVILLPVFHLLFKVHNITTG